jgi:hypothetical protein
MRSLPSIMPIHLLLTAFQLLSIFSQSPLTLQVQSHLPLGG